MSSKHWWLTSKEAENWEREEICILYEEDQDSALIHQVMYEHVCKEDLILRNIY